MIFPAQNGRTVRLVVIFGVVAFALMIAGIVIVAVNPGSSSSDKNASTTERIPNRYPAPTTRPSGGISSAPPIETESSTLSPSSIIVKAPPVSDEPTLTPQPSRAATEAPTEATGSSIAPTNMITTPNPSTSTPSHQPSIIETTQPTPLPSTATPSETPSSFPTQIPTETSSLSPSEKLKASPSTSSPSLQPTKLSIPNGTPSTAAPSLPTQVQSSLPTGSTINPTLMPMNEPTNDPSVASSANPSMHPSLLSSEAPSVSPSAHPSIHPSLAPSEAPSLRPTGATSIIIQPPTPLQITPEIVLEEKLSGLGIITDIQSAGDDRLFVVDKSGKIHAFQMDTDGDIQSNDSTIFLDISALVSVGGERGLLGLAFHPNFVTNRHFFVNYVDVRRNTIISRFSATADGSLGDPSSELILATIEQPFGNHNGGQLQFKNGYLYISTGDGGSRNDPERNGQALDTLLGKILRVNVDNVDKSADATLPIWSIPVDNPFANTLSSPYDAIWVYGLRNPWRFSFDRLTGDMWIGDVGQGLIEEINFQPSSSSGGENYGWGFCEGSLFNDDYGEELPDECASCGDTTCFATPAIEHDHTEGEAVIGGYVYQGVKYADLIGGTYFYTDYVRGTLWGAAPRGGLFSNEFLLESALSQPTTFGEDGNGELYVGTANGVVYSIKAVGPTVRPAPSALNVPPSPEPSPVTSSGPSDSPSRVPSVSPTDILSVVSSAQPSVAPSKEASGLPSFSPTIVESSEPTISHSDGPSLEPTGTPSAVPSTDPSPEPTSDVPSELPSSSPSIAKSTHPSSMQSGIPSGIPSLIQSAVPTQTPSISSSVIHSLTPSVMKSSDPTRTESISPSEAPSFGPTVTSSGKPSSFPTETESGRPSSAPSSAPSSPPSKLPSLEPTILSSNSPSVDSSAAPSPSPSLQPTNAAPSSSPSAITTQQPTTTPSVRPSSTPSLLPSAIPSMAPTPAPSFSPSAIPTQQPTLAPSFEPTSAPSVFPSIALTALPTQQVTRSPTPEPTESTVSPTVPPTPANLAENQPLTPAPSYDPDISMLADGITYRPGHLTVNENGLLLSQGLKSRILANTGQKVKFANGESSSELFHGRPDGAATFAFPDDDPENPGGYVYVSNSEMVEEGEGGVGAIYFDKFGNLTGYKMLLTGTTMNCGGGRTPWQTWVSCEELVYQGEVYQVDPFDRRAPQKSAVAADGGRFESFTFDDRDKSLPRFFVSEDRSRGALRRFTPSVADWDDPWNMLHGNGTLEFLVLEPDPDNEATGTYRWTHNKSESENNAKLFYPESEGIDRDGKFLYMVCKRVKYLFIFDLDSFTYERFPTEHGLMDGKPDQISHFLGDDQGILYFTEEQGGTNGVHGRNSAGQFFTILETPGYHSETTGVNFSPDGSRLIFAMQDDGVVLEVTRTDGRSFRGKTLNLKYHNRATEPSL